MKNSSIVIIVTIVIVIILGLGLGLGLGEHVRKNYTLQEFKNVNTNRASFSLTTIPSRINLIEPNLKSLLEQKPNTVYLNIPYIFKKTGEEYKLPKWLDKYIDNGEITVIRTEDKGPATKFLGLLEEKIHPEHYIIVVDDDQIYNDKLLSNLIYKADSIGGEGVVSSKIDSGLVTGYGGFIFKRKLLDNITKFIWPKECFLVDDAWITGYFKHQGIQMVQLFDISVANVSIEKTANNIFEFMSNIMISNINLKKGSYRAKVQQINPLYEDRGDKNLQCEMAINQILNR